MNYRGDYGLALTVFNEEKEKIIRIAIPYIRKDTPVLKSNFSNLLLKIVLTIKIYVEQFNGILQDEDIYSLVLNRSYLTKIINESIVSEKFNNLFNPYFNLTSDELHLDIIKAKSYGIGLICIFLDGLIPMVLANNIFNIMIFIIIRNYVFINIL
jgi:hypothetical protein